LECFIVQIVVVADSWSFPKRFVDFGKPKVVYGQQGAFAIFVFDAVDKKWRGEAAVSFGV
jgi:hypothetical protein